MLYFLNIFISCLFRVSILDVSSQVGWIIGNYSSAIVFKITGFNGIYGLTGALLGLNLFYTFFFLKESRYLRMLLEINIRTGEKTSSGFSGR